MNPHTLFVKAVLLAVQDTFPRWVLWEQQKVAVMTFTADGRMRPVKTSLKGIPDIMGFTDRIDGFCDRATPVGIECKIAPDTLKRHQRVFRDALIGRGGIHIVAIARDKTRSSLMSGAVAAVERLQEIAHERIAT